MIRFDAVTKQFPDGTVAVDELTLTAPTGKITVLVGPSGCGKTTSLRMVNRMIEPTRGTITLDGQDTGRMNQAELRRGMGYVIQHAGLFPHRTVLDNIGTVPRLLGWDKKKTRDTSRELLERVGLAPELGERYPAQLSGGQQQRVGVARALAADPPVMLMDEPFSAVDPVVREQLQDEFLRLQSELGKTIVFVTHDIDEAIKLGDQVAVLRVGGRLAQVAEPAYLLAHPADDFVADFVGRDRGYRALGFQEAPRLSLHSEPTVVLGERPDRTDAGWLLVVDDDRHPLGWVEPDAHRRPRGGRGRPAPWWHGGPRTRFSACGARLGAVVAEPSWRDRRRRRGAVRHGAAPTRCSTPSRPRSGPSATRPTRCTAARPRCAATRTCRDLAGRQLDTVLTLTWRSLYLAGIPLVLGFVVSIPLGWVASRWSRTYPAIITSTGLLYTIPSLAHVRHHAGAAGHQDPRPGQRHRRHDDLHRGAARAHRRRRAQRRARRHRAGGDRDGLQGRPAAVRGRAAARRTGRSPPGCGWPR